MAGAAPPPPAAAPPPPAAALFPHGWCGGKARARGGGCCRAPAAPPGLPSPERGPPGAVCWGGCPRAAVRMPGHRGERGAGCPRVPGAPLLLAALGCSKAWKGKMVKLGSSWVYCLSLLQREFLQKQLPSPPPPLFSLPGVNSNVLPRISQ